LHQRIEQRVEKMFADGLVEEVQGLLDRYGSLSHTANQAVGYKEVIAHLQQQTARAATIEQVKIRTRRFARAQETWFRNMKENRQLTVSGDFNSQELAAQIIAAGKSLGPRA
jgi:tRNA dimethylallyltransferase